MPTISMQTPTYDRAHVLHRAYDSQNRQTTRDIEGVVMEGVSIENPALNPPREHFRQTIRTEVARSEIS